MTEKKEKIVKKEPSYSMDQLLTSNDFKKDWAILLAILDKDKKYTLKEVAKLTTDFKNKKVRL